MEKIPFNPYDFFGYLASGVLVVSGMELTFGFPHILGQKLEIVDGAILLIAVYVAGQIMATPAKAVLEDGLVGKVLGRPSVNLFRSSRPQVLGRFFPGFYAPLPMEIGKRVLDKAERDGVKGTGEVLFLYVRYHPGTLGNEKLMAKLESFLNQYGFSRNLAFTSLVVSVGLLTKATVSGSPGLIRYAVTGVVVGLLLLFRYLKFFRQYSYEMFNVYGGK